MPAEGVRVAAMARPDSLEDAASGSALSSIAVTDVEGRYRLENIPAGLYLIMAGKVALPTFYPGALDFGGAKTIAITPGADVNGIDFVVDDASIPIGDEIAPSWTIPFQVRVEEGGKLPLWSSAGTTQLAMTRKTDGVRTTRALNGSFISLQFRSVLAPEEYVVRIENLPEGYSVKSMTFGSADLLQTALSLSRSDFTLSAPSFLTFGQRTVASRLGTSTSSLAITLGTDPTTPPASGFRIVGRVGGPGINTVGLSGVPGILYADGAFEFRGVLPGRYLIMTDGNPGSTRGAAIVVGERDLSGIELQDLPVMPFDVRAASAPAPSANLPDGPIPMPSLHGRVLEEQTGRPVADGTAIVTGVSRMEHAVDADGYFEIHLLPGAYRLEIESFGHATIRRDIVLTEDNLNLELSAERL
jgi:hypothetical protein